MKDAPYNQRVIAFLENNSPQEFNRASIALYTKIPKASLGTVLTRLVKDRKIQKCAKRGFYRAAGTIELEHGRIFKELKIHHLTLYCNDAKKMLQMNTPLAVETAPDKKINPRNKGIDVTHWWRGNPINIQIYRSKGSIMVYSRFSNSALDYSEFNAFCAWLEAMFSAIPLNKWLLKTVDINSDTPLLHLAGLNEISLKTFKNMWLEIYQKGTLVRAEARLTTEIRLSQALEIFKNWLGVIEAEIVVK